MLKEIGVKEALQRYLTVDDVKVLIHVSDDPSNWAGCEAAMLGDILNNLIFLVDDVDHMIIKEPDEIVFADEPPIETDDTKPEQAEETKPEAEEEEATRRGPKGKAYFDEGKARALYEAGWKVPAIAEEMGFSQATVYNHLKRMGVDMTR